MVGEVVDKTGELDIRPKHDGVSLDAWRRIDSNQIIRLVKDFKKIDLTSMTCRS